eukprot:jgi/Ulvmu1/8913/UM005_0004.1
MQAFKFNFGLSDQEDGAGAGSSIVTSPAHLFQPRLCRAINGLPFMPVLVPRSAADESSFRIYKVHIETADAAATLGVDAVNLADVVPGQYEGGFKLWEGAQDLMDILAFRVTGPWPRCPCSTAFSSIDSKVLATLPANLQGKRVLELGCGHGLPGVLCMLAGAQVVFHDLNRGVIEMATVANVVRNMTMHGQEEATNRAGYIDGDFQSASGVLCREFSGQQFDLILTAESIYNSASVPPLIAAFSECLAPAGIILVAAKSYYFGVGGGVASFKKDVIHDGRFQCQSLTRVDDGKSNMREVMLLTRV